MSVYKTIEDKVVETLTAITVEGSPLLATAKGYTQRDRKALMSAIGRELLPAAYVMMTGRENGDKAVRRPGLPTLSVLLAAKSLRNEDDARTGSDDVTGMFTLSEEVIQALQDLVVDSDRLLLLIDDQPVGSSDGMVIWEHRYELRRQTGSYTPLFRGSSLIGSDSVVRVELGDLQREVSTFSFPGIEGVFERHMGARERPIFWRGQLRAASDTALNTIEENIEDEVRLGISDNMWDPWARTHRYCVLRTFRRKGPRLRDELTGEALQDFELEFAQLAF